MRIIYRQLVRDEISITLVSTVVTIQKQKHFHYITFTSVNRAPE